MAVDPISPVAPARVRVFLVPIGSMKRTSFASFTRRLQRESSVRLGDISPDTRPGKTTFSPLAFPNGAILYNMCTNIPPASHAALSPFETFRETFLIFGIADAKEIQSLQNFEDSISHLQRGLNEVSEQHPKSLLSKLLVFDVPESCLQKRTPEEIIYVPSLEMSRSTTMKTIMCDVSAEFLGELSAFAANIQDMQNIESPTVGIGQSNVDASFSSRSLDMTRSESSAQESRPETPSQSVEASRDNFSSNTLPNLSLQQPAMATSRPSSPANGLDFSPTVTADQESVGQFQDEENNLRRARPKSMAFVRDSSHDRRSQQPVSVNSTERARNRLRARQSLIIGTLHLHAGRWTDALRELVDSTTRARAFGDHLWHAKGLENILATLLLLAWTGSDFQIPRICYPVSDKSASTKASSLSHPGSTGTDTNTSLKRVSNEGSYQAFSTLLPDLVNMIVGTYTRIQSIQGEGVPQYCFSECVLRLSSLLAVINKVGGTLSRDVLQTIVLAKPLITPASTSIHPGLAPFVKGDICSLVFRAYPVNASSSGLSLQDTVSIYAGIASVMSILGLHRKRALVVKEMLTAIVPSLIQARKVGAAELGIHPAASLATLHGLTGERSAISKSARNGDEDTSTFRGLLVFLCATYGVLKERQPLDQVSSSETKRMTATKDEDLLDVIVEESIQRGFGGLSLKVDILRLCAHFSEALPNFQDVMQFTASLLRTAGPGTAPKTGSMDGLVRLAREEQVRLAAKLHRTLGAFPPNESARLETTYWDRFLVRDISLSDVVEEKRLIPIKKSELSKLASGTYESTSLSQGPFLHNPFLKPMNPNINETTVAAKEPITFEVHLQNLYDFEVIVEDIALIIEGVEFRQDHQNLVLGPFRIQRAFITGVANESGELRISGCTVKFQGCSKQNFLLFSDAWIPDQETKVKQIGLRTANSHTTAGLNAGKRDDEDDKIATASKPKPSVLTIPVEKEQPLLTIVGTSTSQAIVSVLEGETQSFSITVRNDATLSAVDFAQVSFTDIIGKSTNVSDRNNIGAPDLYELDYAALHRQPFRWLRKEEDETIQIKPSETMTFDISVLGRPGLSKGSVYINYAYLGATLNELKSQIYTRRLCFSITVTVKPSIHLKGFDIVPVKHVLPQNGDKVVGLSARNDAAKFHQGHHCSSHDPYFMLLLDLQNSAARPMTVKVHQIDTNCGETDQDADDRGFATGDVVQPGQTVRLALRIQKLFVENPQKSIPVLRPTSQRQHVVDHSKSATEEQAQVEAFWYREKLLKSLRAEWQEVDSQRKGSLDLRGISFNAQMIEVLRQDRVSVKIEILKSTENADPGKTSALNSHVVGIDDFFTVKTTIHNRTNEDIRFLLTLQPKLSFEPLGQAVDLTKRMAWTGLLKRPVQKLAALQTIEFRTCFSILSAGRYEILASADIASKELQPESQFRPDDQSSSARHFACPQLEHSGNRHLGSAICEVIAEDG